MGKIHKLLAAFIASMVAFSCTDLKFGDSFLEKAPGVDVTIDTIFASKQYAERALVAAYATLRTSLDVKMNDGTPYEYQDAGNKLGWDNLDALTDIIQTYCTWGGVMGIYYNGSYNAETENGSHSTKMSFQPKLDMTWRGIRRAFIFINNVDKVPDMTPEEKAVRKGEAKMIIACQYSELLRHFGGVPVLKDAVSADNDGSTDYSRQTFEYTLDYILQMCDEAAALLPWTVSRADDGRFTKASALGLKVRVLLLAASPLFNASEPYLEPRTPNAANASKIKSDAGRMTWLGDYRADRWQKVADACEAFFRENEANGNPYALVSAKGAAPTQEDYRNAFSSCYADRCNGEILISSARHCARFGSMYHRQYFGCSTDINPVNTGRGYGGGAITLNYVDLFTDKDGNPASYSEWISKHGHEAPLENSPFTNRDVRLYESVMISGDRFRDRLAEMWEGGIEKSSFETRAPSGFCLRKFLWDYDVYTFQEKPANYAYLRLAEIYLAYAEALNELGRTEDAMKWLDKTRERVGLPKMTTSLLARVQAGKTFPSYPECSLVGNEMLREEILDERAREFCFEEVRWFDIVRWKRKDIFTKNLYGITVKATGGIQNENGTWLSYDGVKLTLSDPFELPVRYWKTNFSPKWYLSALPTDEINKAYGLVQNPGW